MFIDLTDDQRALQAELRHYFADLVTDEEAAIMRTERHGPTYREVVRRMGKDGWLGVGWPVEFGGRGFGDVEQQIFANEAAHELAGRGYVVGPRPPPSLPAPRASSSSPSRPQQARRRNSRTVAQPEAPQDTLTFYL